MKKAAKIAVNVYYVFCALVLLTPMALQVFHVPVPAAQKILIWCAYCMASVLLLIILLIIDLLPKRKNKKPYGKRV